MTLIVLVLVLGAAGAIVRVLVARALPPLAGTLAVNLAAAFLLGITVSWDGVAADGIRIGLLGAASTWSTLANELAFLLHEQRFRRAGVYVVLSMVLGVGAAWIGLEVGGT